MTPIDPQTHLLVVIIFSPFHTVHAVLEAKILEWFAIPSPSGPHFIRTLRHVLSVLGGPVWCGS